MKGRIKAIDGIYPVTVDEAIYIYLELTKLLKIKLNLVNI